MIGVLQVDWAHTPEAIVVVPIVPLWGWSFDVVASAAPLCGGCLDGMTPVPQAPGHSLATDEAGER